MTQKVSELEDRSRELTEFIKIQEEMLKKGSVRLVDLNNEFTILNREYSQLLSKKNQIAQDIEVMSAHLDLFSDD